jgi:hypothetical protein
MISRTGGSCITGLTTFDVDVPSAVELYWARWIECTPTTFRPTISERRLDELIELPVENRSRISTFDAGSKVVDPLEWMERI